MAIFQKSVIQKYLKGLNTVWLNTAYDKFNEIFNPEKIETIKNLKEEEYQDGFLRDLFVEVLGYTLKPDKNFNLVREFKNQTNSKKADGAILKDEKAVAVIELKSTKTKDLTSITEQAFNYKVNQPGCKYVITSNFQKLRFYVDYTNEYEEFNLFNLQKSDFELLYLILRKKSIFADTPQKLKEETKFHEQNVSEQLYKDYSNLKNKIFENLVLNNTKIDKLILFKKSQKLLDRLLFIFFAEDCGLLPANLISKIIDRYELLKKHDARKPLYDVYKQYFEYMNTGKEEENPADAIPAYNGGLFAADKLLDSFIIDDKILKNDCLKLSAYNFNTEVDVNILGHIFEHSLNEIEEIEQNLKTTGATTVFTKTETKTSKRKKDGVFYTPKYISQYIVDNTLGALCTEKRKEINIYEIEFDKSYRTKKGLNKKGKQLYEKLNNYKQWLKSLKILDPACGSGAFLNQALQFLITEHELIDDLIADLTNQKVRLFDTDKTILDNNLYGVDINEESVEIAKLSLWLRTAQKGRELSNLNNNIKCGNSLIDDVKFTSKKAFKWENEFNSIIENGGFDVVIGNPPYGAQLSSKTQKFLSEKFKMSPTILDTYLLFLINIPQFLRKSGVLSYIIPSTWLYMSQYKNYRMNLISEFEIPKILLYRNPVFEDATVETCIVFMKKNKPTINSIYNYIEIDRLTILKDIRIKQKRILKNSNISLLVKNSKYENLFTKITNLGKPLNKISTIICGLTPYRINKGKPKQTKEIVKNKLFDASNKKNATYRKYLMGRDFQKYVWTIEKERWISYGEWLAEPRYTAPFDATQKIVIRQTSDKIIAHLDKNKYLSLKNVHNLKITTENLDYEFLLSLLNSKLLDWWYQQLVPEKGRIFAEVKGVNLKKIPIKLSRQQHIFTEKANIMLLLNRKLQVEKNSFLKTLQEEKQVEKLTKKIQDFQKLEYDTFKKELKKKKIKINLGAENNEWREYFNTTKEKINDLQNQINQTNNEIDKMVYELYELTDQEIEIIENID